MDDISRALMNHVTKEMDVAFLNLDHKIINSAY